MSGTTASGWPYTTDADEPRNFDAHSLALANKLEADAALKIHVHQQVQTHYLADTDSSPTALHHTLGTGANQAAAGNHVHTLDSLSDVVAAGASVGQALVFDGASWSPGAGGGGGGGGGFLGTWNSSTAYTAGSIVIYNGVTWGTSVAVSDGQPVPGVPPPPSTLVPPGSDKGINAIDIRIATDGTSASSPAYSAAGFTLDEEEDYYGYKTGWFKYRPASSGSVTFSTDGSSTDTLLNLWSGPDVFDFASLNHLTSDDDSGAGSASMLTWNVTGGTVYYLMVADYSDSEVGSIHQLNLINARATTPVSPWVQLTADHGLLVGLGDDDHTQYLKTSEILAGTNVTVDTGTSPGSVIIMAAGGATSGYERTLASKTTASLAVAASETGTIALAIGYRLYRIQTDAPARVRLYTTAAKRDADLARAVGIRPTGDHGLILEFVTTVGLLSADLSPLVDGFDGKATPDGVIPYTVTNTGADTAAVTVMLSWLKTEG